MALTRQEAALPRLAIAAPASGHGKTTIATGLMAALRHRGLEISGHKVGPDYIDPSYHALATGRAGRNLDPHLHGEERLVPLLLHGAQAGSRPADVAIIEGVMGLFDGALGTDGFASTAHVATITHTPVVLVVDARAISRSIAAMVHGFATYDTRVSLAGVILNKVGSERHETELRAALDGIGIPVLGVLYRSDDLEVPSRHLGLVPVAEREPESGRVLDALRERIGRGIDLDAVVQAARTAPALAGSAWDPRAEIAASNGDDAGTVSDDRGHRSDGLTTGDRRARPVIAAAAGPAFTFRYAENMELLDAAGIDVVDLDPLTDDALPAGCSGLYFGGGFPEVHAELLSANEPLRTAVAEIARTGPVVAECAGLTYLCRELDGLPMAGVLDASAQMTERRTLGYRSAVAATDNLLAPASQQVTAHEFHRTRVTPGHGDPAAWQWDGHAEGFATSRVHASYLHVHWAGHPHMARRFAAAARHR
ncbi:cobyrinate a,c-diamide synthase [Actinobacteria bacterium YIM 96077]|uniref:Hydrogenobyrinate a,c-diamide synthase n=1 Tax=Phytoactinopolyspora halophila TaxID=1981511 RepID=A0A329QTY3_9ACTN|nr:cobyrinate a,c-diamide synthase [Phytoactinopolyspora halophila]AYY15057.1 cobyrinate a,c-diamide synthase [Actinobacteria bacterium YIM 96077]RAW14178.1 cobyrinate a,c-diamide synthase [Phytoactinopolyspora halophila]